MYIFVEEYGSDSDALLAFESEVIPQLGHTITIWNNKDRQTYKVVKVEWVISKSLLNKTRIEVIVYVEK